MNMFKAILAMVALSFSLNSFALTDEEYLDLTDAISTGNTKVVKKYMDADPSLINQKFFAWEPLQMAASHGNLDIVKYLIAKGADKNYVHPASQNTAFHMAAFSGNVELIKFLAASGVDVNLKLKGDVSLIRYFRDLEQPDMVKLMESVGVKDDGCQDEKCF
jgi:ankyrin repeat protein